MSSARNQILRDILAHLPVSAPLPALNHPWSRYDDPTQQFLEVLRSVGGTGKVLRDVSAVRNEIAGLASQLEATSVCSALPDLYTGNADIGVDDAHALASVDLAILPGELAVAENAAVWVTGKLVPQRVAFFLSQHVALVVPAERIVHNMHEAYDWLQQEAGPEGPFKAAKWGTFMSGPSKTADIEQALVIGAHGARSLHVFLVQK
jgi:L-lactate dehydrogenase complex protein LldG